jgi:NAD(P)-dependent dehydrogenase (short-subunit alcohol dehydrogenase family)
VTQHPCAGRVALVTGASRGIGAAIAERLASAGATVAVTARSVDSHPDHLPGTARETVERIESRGGRAEAIYCDVFDPDSCAAAVEACRKSLGPVDVLVNNAAAGPYRTFEKLSLRDFEVTFTANVRAALVTTQLVAPAMRERGGGWIVNVSSASAEMPQGPPYGPWESRGGMHLYAASKAALNRLTAGLAAELHADGVAVNALSPVAAVITPGVEALGATRWIDESMTEPVEAVAEAALALSTCEPSLTGRVTYSLPLLRELGREVRTLDGASVVALS